ncbi:uncharacterized protein EV422DRAFT_492944 [Fimicolochytrium jonesii]|uniref:uncharacterized protein n=1 Tax=Fimicolochytrium jonesii TaxID=1396493 RepID=UPI0022FE0B09|nr:uncharacterized protein EV422DRAFT_492944 [Fimicolochytrium jonesii]KAI8824550.1 hypothetical protein EV422DRAFT_492944 [Fimicolochytrium jonesii]
MGVSETLKWRKLAPASTNNSVAIPPRYEHAAVIIPGSESAASQLLVMYGAGNDGLLNDVWTFDLDKQQWTSLCTKGTAPSARTLRSVAAIEDQRSGSRRVYIFGGGAEHDKAVDDGCVYCFDVGGLIMEATHSVIDETQQPAPAPRLGHTFTAVGTKIYLFGGMAGDVTFDDVWVFDTVSREWKCLEGTGDVPSPRSGHSATVNRDKIYVYGGLTRTPKTQAFEDVYVFETVHTVWTKLDPASLPPGPPGARLGHDACAITEYAPLIGSMADADPSNTTAQIAITAKDAMVVFAGMDLGGMYNSVYLLEV